MQPPLRSQTRASGVPINQNVHHRGIAPVANRARNFICSDYQKNALNDRGCVRSPVHPEYLLGGGLAGFTTKMPNELLNFTYSL